MKLSFEISSKVLPNQVHRQEGGLRYYLSVYTGNNKPLTKYDCDFKIPLSPDVKAILSLDPPERTSEQLHTALVALQQTVDAFSEFPINMQKSLVKRGWYEQ